MSCWVKTCSDPAVASPAVAVVSAGAFVSEHIAILRSSSASLLKRQLSPVRITLTTTDIWQDIWLPDIWQELQSYQPFPSLPQVRFSLFKQTQFSCGSGGNRSGWSSGSVGPRSKGSSSSSPSSSFLGQWPAANHSAQYPSFTSSGGGGVDGCRKGFIAFGGSAGHTWSLPTAWDCSCFSLLIYHLIFL